jgi:hypothetical protein
MAVKYGSGYLQETSPTAIVAADSDIGLGVGVRLLEIGKGPHIAIGDSHNGRIDIAASGLSIVHTHIARTKHEHHPYRHHVDCCHNKESAAR